MTPVLSEKISILQREEDNTFLHLTHRAPLTYLRLPKKKNFSENADPRAQLLSAMESNPLLAEKLQKLKVINPPPDNLPATIDEPHFNNMLTIYPTSGCNFRCLYCYASAGDKKTVVIDEATIDTAIEYFYNRLFDKTQFVRLSFHGGGEPLTALDKMDYAWQRFKAEADKRGINAFVSTITNGAFGRKEGEWIVKNCGAALVSIDGVNEIQNILRPMAGGQKSLPKVLDNLNWLKENDVKLMFRPTITNKNIDQMRPLIDLAEQYGCSAIHFEPCINVGRADTGESLEPDADEFVAASYDAFLYALEKDIAVLTGTIRALRVGTHYSCAAFAAPMMNVTAEGYLSSCTEFNSSEDAAAMEYFYGRIEHGKVTIDEKRVQKLKLRNKDTVEECMDCFLRFTCAGGCPAKSVNKNGSVLGVDEYFCEVGKKLNEKILDGLFSGELQPKEELLPRRESYDYGDGEKIELFTFHNPILPGNRFYDFDEKPFLNKAPSPFASRESHFTRGN